MRTHARPGDVVLVDCLTLWVSNAVLRQITKEPDVVTVPHEDWVAAEARVLAATGELLDSGLTAGVSLVLVSNEVGMGLVPPFPLGRRYRDILGRVNQAVARRADSVVLMIAGLPVDLRRLAAAELGVVTPGSKDPSPGDEPCDPLASP